MARLSTIPAYFAATTLPSAKPTTEPEATSPPLQLPTPKSSCHSETSSCIENASTPDESEQKPRPTRRVTRASLRGETASAEGEEQQSKDEGLKGGKNREDSEMSGVTGEGHTSRSSQAGDGILTPPETMSTEALPLQEANSERRVMRRSSRFAASKDAQPDSKTSSRQQAPKEDVVGNKEKEDQKNSDKSKGDAEGATRRRSSRLTVLEKAGDIVNQATSVLGKRSRDAMEKSKGKLKDVGRRASLRPRNALGEANAPPKPEVPEPKKRRVSESDAVLSKKKVQEELVQPPKPPPKRKPKRWLAHGLYAGQDRNFDPRLTEAKNRVKNAKANSSAPTQRKLLPLPMFAGERLLEQGRNFKLPFDIFSPLPVGQPKPDEWRKTNKSRIFAVSILIDITC